MSGNEIPSNNEKNNSHNDSKKLESMNVSENEQLNKVQNSCQKIIEKQNEQEQFNKEIVENQKKLLNGLYSIQNELKEVKENQKTVESVRRIILAPEITPKQHQISIPVSPCKFVVRSVFKNLSGMEDNKLCQSENQEHFGVQWSLGIYEREEHLAAFVFCEPPKHIEKWTIDVESEFKVVHPNGASTAKPFSYCFNIPGGRGYHKIVQWKEMMRDYVVDDTLILEVPINITSMTGIYKDNLRSFDESTEEFSDVVLKVKDEKFYVLRKYLAAHSSYFKALFLGGFNESDKTEVILSGIDAFDFQNYLEVLYGEPAIDDVTVEGVLVLADMYDTEIVVRKCNEFLLEKSTKELKKRLQMSVKYNLNKLKEKCLNEIKTMEAIRSVISDDIMAMDPTIANVLLEKSLSFNY